LQIRVVLVFFVCNRNHPKNGGGHRATFKSWEQGMPGGLTSPHRLKVAKTVDLISAELAGGCLACVGKKWGSHRASICCAASRTSRFDRFGGSQFF
jgi:hypothetical protein